MNQKMNKTNSNGNQKMESISICFQVSNRQPIIISCQESQKILDLIDKYRKLSGDLETKNFFYYNYNLFNFSTIKDLKICDDLGIILDFPSELYILRKPGAGLENKPPINVPLGCGEKISELIKRYRLKSGDKDSKINFVFNAKKLNPNSTKEEAGLCEMANIFIVGTRGVRGAGYSMMFTDVSKNKTKELKFSKMPLHIER